MRTAILAAAVLSAALACTAPVDWLARAPASARVQAQAERRIPRLGYAVAGAPVREQAVAPAAAASDSASLVPRASVAANMVIRTGQANIEVDSLERAVREVRLLARRVGGYVANSAMQTGRGELRSASLEVKLPADRFDEGLNGLAPIGKLESVNVTAEDVGEEFSDVAARMANARRLEARLLDLVATRTGRLKDVLDAEQELARVREQIDRYEGRLRYLKAHAALSTLTICVHEPVPIAGHAGSSVLGEALEQAWRNFVGLAALVIASLGVVLPLGAVLALAWLAVRRWRSRALPAGS
jgi:hypothetical protein